jgi:hypothetical protein
VRHIVRVPLSRMRRHLDRLQVIYTDLSRCDAGEMDWEVYHDCDVETLRNLITAIGWLEGWITYRKHNRRDPTRKDARP